MNFVHEDPDFEDLVRIAANRRGISLAMVEKDYWVTHSLWALHVQGFEVWFKGGTALSKGFGLIERFSEDLDLKLEPGRVATLAPVRNWRSVEKGPVAARRAHFETLASVLDIPGTTVTLEAGDKGWRNGNLAVRYPGRHMGALDVMLSPFVLLEVGDARVTPSVERSLSSFVHDELQRQGLVGDYQQNRPRRVRCVHPLVTLLEKLEALHRRALDTGIDPAKFVRHFDDAASVIEAEKLLPPLLEYADSGGLLNDMLAKKHLVTAPESGDPAFTPDHGARWSAVRSAHPAIGPMFWGPRRSLDDACVSIRGWVKERLGS